MRSAAIFVAGLMAGMVLLGAGMQRFAPPCPECPECLTLREPS